MASVKLEGLSEINKIFHKLDKNLKCDMLKEIADQTFLSAKKRAGRHSKTGKMEHNLRSDVSCQKSQAMIKVDDSGMMVNWNGKKINYGIFVHYGSRAHKIFPKKKKALRWGDGGKFHFAKVVNHPGYKGDPFLFDALDDATKNVTKIFERFTDGL